MKQLNLLIFISILFIGLSCHHNTVTLLKDKTYYSKSKGLASWYGENDGFNGRLTASGEVFNDKEFTAAHKTFPFNSLVKVTNLENNCSVIVRINDRGPYVKNRIIDLSKRAADKIEMKNKGIAKVEIKFIGNNFSFLKPITYTIQLMSYLTEKEANNYACKFTNSYVELPKTKPALFRVCFGTYFDLKAANTALNQFKKAGYDGFFVKRTN